MLLLKSEIDILKKIKHTNIVWLFDFLESANHFYLVMNYCNQGDFENYIQTKGGYLTEDKAVFFLKQIMNAFLELRKHSIMHRDFKLANILVNNEIIMLGDFGFAKQAETAQSLLGTPLTQSYELLKAGWDKQKLTYDSKADLWSIGVVYFQMLFGQYPFMATTIPELIKDIENKTKNEFQFPTSI